MAKKIVTHHSKYKSVIVSKFDMRKIHDGLKMEMKQLVDFLVFRFEQIGEEAIKIARSKTCGKPRLG